MIYLFIYLFIYLSIYLLIYLFIHSFNCFAYSLFILDKYINKFTTYEEKATGSSQK